MNRKKVKRYGVNKKLVFLTIISILMIVPLLYIFLVAPKIIPNYYTPFYDMVFGLMFISIPILFTIIGMFLIVRREKYEALVLIPAQLKKYYTDEEIAQIMNEIRYGNSDLETVSKALNRLIEIRAKEMADKIIQQRTLYPYIPPPPPPSSSINPKPKKEEKEKKKLFKPLDINIVYRKKSDEY